MYGGNLPDIGKLFAVLGITILVLLPFAAWKLIEIIYWLFTHVKVAV